jgi:dipeptidase E
MVINNNIYVVGLREGTLLSLEENKLDLKGERPLRLFRYGQAPRDIQPGENLNFLL